MREELRYALRVALPPRIYEYRGVKVPIHASSHLRALRRRLFRGAHEDVELNAIEALLREEDTVLEIGAGCGIVSAFIGRRLSDSMRLHAFEPNRALIPSIEAVLRANGLTVNVHDKGVALSDCEQTFFIADDFQSSSVMDRGQGGQALAVSMMGLPALLSTIRPSFIVMDVEGAERDLLKVALPDFVRVVCCEIHPHIIGDDGASDVIRSMLAQGFLLKLDASGGRAVAFTRHVA